MLQVEIIKERNGYERNIRKNTKNYSYQQLAHAANILFDGNYKTLLTGHGSCLYVKRELLSVDH